MFVVGYNTFTKIGACILCGVVIKLLDDVIDEELKDIHTGAILSYGLIIFSLATGFNTHYSVTLLSSAYMVGMFHDLNHFLPTRLKAYQENIFLFLINSLLFSFLFTITSFFSVLLIQLIDDLCDQEYDHKYGYKNFANEFGKIEVLLTCFILGIGLILLDPLKIFIILLSYLCTEWIYIKITKPLKAGELK
ncbi:hypothetical protein [Inediibacterium massiliense]|uniref:hypothetical protein n=1 Tax=Inediibacterium massiliense TaxID=1658111 RepID=UPI0006B6836B|nr:hypothetical protein [Inediibacterium massiliense]